MFERKITDKDVRHVLETGETIENYPNDKPYPSELILGFSNKRPIHTVVANNQENKQKIMITVYEPNLKEWEDDFQRRKK